MTAQANALTLEVPIKCAVGKECFVQKYVDHDPTPGWNDFTCGQLSNDGHKGTDIRLPTLAEMRKGVAVIAATGGTVRATRDGVADVFVQKADPAAIKNKECGNGVVIMHENGWDTQYCHMQNGSIRVKRGDTVKPGDTLGLVGLSGNTEYPHVHFEIRKDGTPVDPYTGLDMAAPCGEKGAPLWSAAAARAMQYRASGFLAAGFAPAVPTFENIMDGQYRTATLPAEAPVLIFWSLAYGIAPEYAVSMKFTGPDGATLAETTEHTDRHKAQYFLFIGKKLKQEAWPKGTYTGHFRVTDGDKPVFEKTATVTVE